MHLVGLSLTYNEYRFNTDTYTCLSVYDQASSWIPKNWVSIPGGGGEFSSPLCPLSLLHSGHKVRTVRLHLVLEFNTGAITSLPHIASHS